MFIYLAEGYQPDMAVVVRQLSVIPRFLRRVKAKCRPVQSPLNSFPCRDELKLYKVEAVD